MEENQQNASTGPATADTPTIESEIATLKQQVADLESKIAALPDLTGLHEKLAAYGIR